MTDLDDIRTGHYPMTGEEGFCVGCQDGEYPCDVVTLLAEVDRLNMLGMSEADYLNGWRDGQAAERVRIAEAIKQLPGYDSGTMHAFVMRGPQEGDDD